MRKMNKKVIVLISLVASSVAKGSPQEITEQFGFLVDEEAENVKFNHIDRKNRIEIKYSLNIEYPNLAIGNTVSKELKERGWTKCVSENEGWLSFKKLKYKKEPFVYRNIKFWTKNETLLTVSMSYYAKKEGIKSLNNELQEVLILIDRYKDIKEVKDRLKIECLEDK